MPTRAHLALLLSFFAAACGGAPSEETADESADPIEANAAKPKTKPPTMGWNTWNKLRCNYDEATILAQADALVSSGMRDAGYDTVVLDDCWQGPRDASGKLTWDASKPDGAPKKVMNDTKFRQVFPEFKFTDFEDGITETVKYYESVYPY